MKDNILYRRAQVMSLKYEFVDTIEELNVLTNALYLSLMWAKTIHTSKNE